jgi:hypothetical protein
VRLICGFLGILMHYFIDSSIVSQTFLSVYTLAVSLWKVMNELYKKIIMSLFPSSFAQTLNRKT